MLGPIGVTELIIILVIVVILFGVNKLPKLGKGLGEGIRNFKDSVRSGEQDDASGNETPNNTKPTEPK
ncbi:MAG: twin-arginine translocase TatA/TatE family subunit [Deltaproteobacteria bacterium]|jgi:sec-independent protein translocase protein TatA|nr:twin-arginine translocase TatA/TatE family subunit [Deltaproteobacteria bacterium]MBW2535805.1 twin-arginine translocase TatA/TatE family subunit [Deltaproteobacteria bacterium]